MGAAAYISSVISTLFRLSAYIFLRVVPVRFGKVVLPSLYLIYLASLFVGVNNPASARDSASAEKAKKHAADTPESPLPTPRYTSPLAALVFTLPTASYRLRRFSIFVNTLLLIFAFDFVARPVLYPAHDVIFSRVGAVGSDSVKVIVRYPQANATDGAVKVVYRRMTSTNVEKWKEGPTISLAVENDWVNTGPITGLWPKTSYEYMLTMPNATNAFLPYPPNPLPFRTFPDPRLPTGTHFRFIVTSCTMPNFPYIPGRGESIKGFDLLANYIWPKTPTTSVPIKQAAAASLSDPDPAVSDISDTKETSQPGDATAPPSGITGPSAVTTHKSLSEVSVDLPSTLSPSPATPVISSPRAARTKSIPATTAETEFLLFLGDFIYADVPFYHGDDKEAYRRLYRRNYASESFRKVYERLPVFHMYDDHEIINNYIGSANDSTPPYPNASNAFDIYHAQANYDPTVIGQYYYDFRYGDAAFFVLDTRRYRSQGSQADPGGQTMLGDKQLAALHGWLAQANQTATFKFIVSSVPFTSLWQHDALTDSWAGFKEERRSILAAIHSVPNVIILSGDRHEFAAIEYNVGPTVSSGSHSVLEFSTSPLSMFYIPFFRTLKMASQDQVEKRTVESMLNEEGVEQITEKTVLIPEERVLKYIAQGHHKWSAFEIDTRDPKVPVANVEVMIDGSSAFRVRIQGTPVRLRTSTALGSFIPRSFKGLMDKVGLKPSKWF